MDRKDLIFQFMWNRKKEKKNTETKKIKSTFYLFIFYFYALFQSRNGVVKNLKKIQKLKK